MTDEPKSLRALSCADDYDPNSMSVPKAREFIRAFLTPVTGVERVALRAALGRVLAADVVSPMRVPAHDNSAMDGYAVRFADLAADGEATLRVVGTSYAGTLFDGVMGPGECVRIMTGAKIPDGADTVVIQEQVRVEGDAVRIGTGHRKGQNLRRAGEDVEIGQTVLRPGTWIRPADLGLAASLGIAELAVYRRLRVAFFSTGDELRSIGTPAGGGPDLRLEPLHDLRHADAPRAARSSTWAWCGTTPVCWRPPSGKRRRWPTSSSPAAACR